LNAGPDSYGRLTEDGAMFLMGDGSVRFIGNDVDPELLKTMADALPVALPDLTKVPHRRFEYADSGWTRSFLDLDANDDEGLRLVAWHDLSDTPRIVAVYPKGKTSSRPMTLANFRAVLSHFPEIRELAGVSAIDDQAVESLSELNQLEVLQAESIEVTETGLDALKQMPRLRILRAGMTEDTLHRLAKALPKCEVRNTGD
jgi:hypothetical protein